AKTSSAGVVIRDIFL
nr:ECP 32=32 kda metalloproteinase {N-terminal} [Escherichia coli, A2, Peptide Partial, 15 aa] [Escherichia coli]